MRRRRVVAEDRVVTTGQNGRDKPGLQRQRYAADAVHPAVLTMQSPTSGAAPDRLGAEPDRA
jgi:hypothetical protein